MHDEDLGEHVGGSGHLGFKSYQLKNIDMTTLPDDKIQVIYGYIVSVETEFTYYPDNPPMEYPRKKKIIINSTGDIVEEVDI